MILEDWARNYKGTHYLMMGYRVAKASTANVTCTYFFINLCCTRAVRIRCTNVTLEKIYLSLVIDASVAICINYHPAFIRLEVANRCICLYCVMWSLCKYNTMIKFLSLQYRLHVYSLNIPLWIGRFVVVCRIFNTVQIFTQ